MSAATCLPIWIHTGAGHWVGSAVIVCADNKATAAAMIREELDKRGLGKEPLDIKKYPTAKNAVIHCDSGDY